LCLSTGVLRIGSERLAQRDPQLESWDEPPLVRKGCSPLPDAPPPSLAVVMTDGGRVQILPDEGAPGQSAPAPAPAPQGDSPAGTDRPRAEGTHQAEGGDLRRGRFWREDKVAALMSMSSEAHQADPCPELPEVFKDPLVVLKLAREVGHADSIPQPEQFRSSGSEAEPEVAQEQGQAEASSGPGAGQKRPGCPEVTSRRVLAARQGNDNFGPMAAALAWALGLMAAVRGACTRSG
jgi:hypothetical protein